MSLSVARSLAHAEYVFALAQVTDHCAIDLDQAAMGAELARETSDSFDAARAIYNNGGSSKPYAVVTLEQPLALRMSKGTPVVGMNSAGGEVLGRLYNDAIDGDSSIRIQYDTSDVQESYVGCRVGSLVEQDLGGCFVDEGALNIDGEEVSYVYDPARDNLAGRTM